jgi:hypothetical protein
MLFHLLRNAGWMKFSFRISSFYIKWDSSGSFLRSCHGLYIGIINDTYLKITDVGKIPTTWHLCKVPWNPSIGSKEIRGGATHTQVDMIHWANRSIWHRLRTVRLLVLEVYLKFSKPKLCFFDSTHSAKQIHYKRHGLGVSGVNMYRQFISISYVSKECNSYCTFCIRTVWPVAELCFSH